MKKSAFLTGAVVLVALLPVAFLALTWSSLPQTVALHFGADFKPDRMGSKNELWTLTLVLAFVSVGLYFLLTNLYRFDPKQKGTGSATLTFTRLATGLVVFLAALNTIIILSAKGTAALQNFLFPLLGLLFAFIGNYMHNIRPNYFAGLRLPWTLSNDENWRRTHQLAGKLWFGGGLLIAVLSLFLPNRVMLPLFFGVIAVLTLVPAFYSYRFFKQHA